MMRPFLLSLSLALLFTSAISAAGEESFQINTVVIPSRNHTRMQPEIFYAFRTAAKEFTPDMKINFTLFNPFQAKFTGKTKESQTELLQLLEASVPEVVAVKKAHPEDDYLLDDLHAYMESHPDSSLAQTYNGIYAFMEPFQFLIIESSDTYGAHPMFYKAGVTEIDTPDGANEMDIIETVYGLFFIDAAFAQDKMVWGTCHGSQIGYIHAGGHLGRLFDFKDGGYDDVELKISKGAGCPIPEETWRIGKHLYTQDKGSDYKDYKIVAYEVPEEFAEGRDVSDKYINKDFQHSLALVEPIPETIEVISYHPLSNYAERVSSGEAEASEHFSDVLKDQRIVDAYKYNNMIGTQYHPQYTYDDLDTYIFFEYLVDQLHDRYAPAPKVQLPAGPPAKAAGQ
ncbi:MAG: hypothetical protein Q7Q73_04280 [Verrucomicrobiota bacterium JB024]|nr:hypothetical protein [Verrucomicrobiota bacterium JB024]